MRKLMKRIEQLNKELKELQQKIEDFQNNCSHREQSIKFDDKNTAKWFCSNCNKNIRFPSPKELEDWISR